MHCFFGKGEQCNYIHCNRVGGEGCLSHKGWQNKRQREKTRRHFQLKQLKFLLRVLYILNPHPTIYTVSNKLLSSHTHTHPHKKSLVKYLFPTRHSHCFLQIPDYSQYFSLMHACTHTHAHALPHACTQTHMHTHTHTHLLHSLPCHYAQASSSSSSSKSSSSSSSTCKQNNDYAVNRKKIHKATSAFNHTWKEIITAYLWCPISQEPRVFTKAYRYVHFITHTHTHTCAYTNACIPPPPTFIPSALCVRGC